MREVKYKFWNVKLKTMTEWKDIIRKEMHHYFNDAVEIPLQYTGHITHTNKKEVYESDVVTFIDCEGVWEIIYNQNELRWEAIRGDGLKNTNRFVLEKEDFIYMRKLGNKYKNPELLEGGEE